jgi:hypothetical protein
MLEQGGEPYAARPFPNGTASRKAHAIVNRLHWENPNATELERVEAFYKIVSQDEALKGLEYPSGHATEHWLCVDCGIDTAPGFPDGPTTIRDIEAEGASYASIGGDSEVYMVREAVWAKAGMEPFGGCLCIGCLERRLGRKLKLKRAPQWRCHYFLVRVLRRLVRTNDIPTQGAIPLRLARVP